MKAKRSDEDVDWFYHEYKIAKRCGMRNICKVVSFLEPPAPNIDKEYFIFMEYCDMGSMMQSIKKHKEALYVGPYYLPPISVWAIAILSANRWRTEIPCLKNFSGIYSFQLLVHSEWCILAHHQVKAHQEIGSRICTAISSPITVSTHLQVDILYWDGDWRWTVMFKTRVEHERLYFNWPVVKLCDFGAAVPQGKKPKASTPDYDSPVSLVHIDWNNLVLISWNDRKDGKISIKFFPPKVTSFRLVWQCILQQNLLYPSSMFHIMAIGLCERW